MKYYCKKCNSVIQRIERNYGNCNEVFFYCCKCKSRSALITIIGYPEKEKN